ncbi:MAG: GNAT family N-acetyltransferase [Lentisphaerae bacterium]|jgi:amino-acid N-acetyltransferase|nr:GNAT family N-acetyltransferase [Lentisphaerota bacterium]
MNNDLLIRPATLADAPHICQLIHSHKDDLLVRPLSDVIMNIDRFYVCDDNGKVVACAAWQILPEVGDPSKASVEVQSVAVDKSYRRRHVGSRIVKEVLKRVEAFAPTQAIVLTFAPEFFASLGFREVPKTSLMHKIYMGCINCTKYDNPFTCPEKAMALNLGTPRTPPPQ